MRVQFTQTDSDGNPVTRQLVVTLDDERHEIDVASTGTANPPKAVAEHLLASDDYAVVEYDGEDAAEAEDGAE